MAGGRQGVDWNETGTRHDPGIQPGDVEELLATDPEVVVLSRSRELRLQTREATLELLASKGIAVVNEETSEAISGYNRLARRGDRVAALIHSTC